MSHKTTTLLKEEHGHILRSLDILDQMATRTAHGEALNPKDVEDIITFLHAFADRHHQGVEEGIFFPALLQDRNQRHYPNLCRLIFEHNQERYLLEGLEDAIAAKKARDFVYCASQLSERLRTHIDKEDLVLFEMADSALSPTEDERVALEMQKFEQPEQQEALSDLLLRLEAMQSEYIGRERVRTATRH